MSRRGILWRGGLLASVAAIGSAVMAGGPAGAARRDTSQGGARRDGASRDQRHGDSAGDRTIVLTATAVALGEYLYLPFQVPSGVNRVAVSMEKCGDASVGIGLFDHRGAGYGSPGFRGVYGEEASSFAVAADQASWAFRPGRIEPGDWTIVVPVFQAATATELTITVTLSFGPQNSAPGLGKEQAAVRDEPGWYRGDLHNHTTESSDARASGSGLSPAEYPAAMLRAGLDFVSLTDHNVTTANRDLAAHAADSGVLLMGGQEMTNWFHGHATVTGLAPGDWVDWRQRPTGVPLQEHERRIDAFFDDVRGTGAYVSAAHPLAGHLAWQFLAEGMADPSLLPHGLEVWNGSHQLDDEAALAAWDTLLRAGHRVFANGGSDLHGTANPGASALGVPTTVVYAESLSRAAVVAALKLGRSFITAAPDGPELCLEAEGPGGQHAIVGGTVEGGAAAQAAVSVSVRGGAGGTLLLRRDGIVAQATPITADQQTVRLAQPIGLGGYVRAELRDVPHIDLEDPVTSDMGMLALTNPIFLTRTGPAE